MKKNHKNILDMVWLLTLGDATHVVQDRVTLKVESFPQLGILIQTLDMQ